MAQKKRRFEQLQAAASTPQEKKKYNDPFQEKVGARLEDFGKKFEGKGRMMLFGLIAAVIIAAVAYGVTVRMRRSGGEAQNALGKAIETSRAQVSETGPMAGSTEKTFKTDKERAEAAITEFKAVADNFGGAVGDKAKYFIAVNHLITERATGVQELEALASGSSEVAKLSKFALAQTRVEDNKLDEAVTLYKELAGMDDAVVAKDTVNFELAKVLEKQDKKQEAAEIYFNIAKAASEAKDMDGKPVRMSETATNAKEKLKEIDPDKAAQIVEPTPETPTIGGPGGMPISIKPN